MKKKIILSGDLKNMVTYGTALYQTDGSIDADLLKEIFSKSPIFENKTFDIRVLGTMQKTTVQRNCSVFTNEKLITLQMRYELRKIGDMEITEKEDQWIKSDVKSLVEHFELLINPFDDKENSADEKQTD